MPIYEYVCNDCKAAYEAIVLSSSQKVACPKCKSESRSQQLSVFAAGKSSSDSSASGAACASGGGPCTPSSCGCH